MRTTWKIAPALPAARSWPRPGNSIQTSASAEWARPNNRNCVWNLGYSTQTSALVVQPPPPKSWSPTMSGRPSRSTATRRAHCCAHGDPAGALRAASPAGKKFTSGVNSFAARRRAGSLGYAGLQLCSGGLLICCRGWHSSHRRVAPTGCGWRPFETTRNARCDARPSFQYPADQLCDPM